MNQLLLLHGRSLWLLSSNLFLHDKNLDEPVNQPSIPPTTNYRVGGLHLQREIRLLQRLDSHLHRNSEQDAKGCGRVGRGERTNERASVFIALPGCLQPDFKYSPVCEYIDRTNFTAVDMNTLSNPTPVASPRAASPATATIVEDANPVARLTIKTLTDKTVTLDYTNNALTLGELKQQLEERVELAPTRQFFVLNGVVYGKDPANDTLPISSLPGFKTPETVLAEFHELEELKRKNAAASSSGAANDDSSTVITVRGIEDLLPTLHLFHYEPTAKALDPLDIATDWDQKNRLKFFKGLWAVAERRLTAAAELLVEVLPTFEESGFMAYRDLVKYAVITAAVAFDRPTLKAKVQKCLREDYLTCLQSVFLRRNVLIPPPIFQIIRSPEVLECIKATAHLEDFINSLYNCRYREFFVALAALEPALKADWLLAPHAVYIIKEMRIKAYSQMLESYSSLSLAVMAQAFGVSVEFIDM